MKKTYFCRKIKKHKMTIQDFYDTLDAEFQKVIDDKRGKLESQTITDIENNEFLHLVEESEIWAGNRLNYLIELAILQKTDYFSLVSDLGISFSNQNDA